MIIIQRRIYNNFTFRQVLLLCCFLTFYFTGNTQTSLSGQVNEYAAFQAQDDCLNNITVDDITGFEAGMGIIIIQMTGAVMQENDNNNFGAIDDQNGVGQYGYNVIEAINGNTITLEFTMQHTYLSNNTQVVGFEIYDNASTSSTVIAQAWDGSTGGVLAIETTDTLTISHDLSTDGLGFRGGVAILNDNSNCTFVTSANNYFYELGNWRGSSKGEGVTALILGKENGRGAQANGGGGGNDHNSGGGGGGNINNGGRGGENDEPSFFGCDGFFPGEGGWPLSVDNTLVYMGGGGGSGHSNNPNPTAGGNGGGIIFVKAPVVIFNGGAITADGIDGESPSGDGAGGGGAGGTILVEATTFVGTPNITATGGNGGDVDNQGIDRCFGPGGGGSGGRFISTISVAAITSGGMAGMTTNSTSCSNGTNGALNGGSGILTTPFSGFVQGGSAEIPAILAFPTDTMICEDELVVFEADIQGAVAILQWQIFSNNAWSNLQESNNVTGTQTSTLQIDNYDLSGNIIRFIFVPSNSCFDPIISTPFLVTVEQQPSASPSFSANGTEVSFMADATNTDSYFWDFGNNQSSDQENPVFDFGQTGTYPVELQIENDCGTISYPLEIIVGEIPQAAFTANFTEGCAPLFVQFTDESTGEFTQRVWTFEGGDPATSTDESLFVQFANPGEYEVTLTLESPNGNSQSSQTITVLVGPTSDYSYETDGLQVSFTNLSTNANVYVWDFDDNQNSNEENPIHTFDAPGVYEVTLNAQNEFCGVAMSQVINLLDTPTDDLDRGVIFIYPNPVSGILHIEGNWESAMFFTTTGQQVGVWENDGGLDKISVAGLPSGVYFARISVAGYLRVFRVLKI